MTARRNTRVSLARKFERNVTKFAPHKALKLIASGKLTYDERVVLHRVARDMSSFDFTLTLHVRLTSPSVHPHGSPGISLPQGPRNLATYVLKKHRKSGNLCTYETRPRQTTPPPGLEGHLE